MVAGVSNAALIDIEGAVAVEGVEPKESEEKSEKAVDVDVGWGSSSGKVTAALLRAAVADCG